MISYYTSVVVTVVLTLALRIEGAMQPLCFD